MQQSPLNDHYAVIFVSTRQGPDDGYEQMAARMLELASAQPGFLGVTSARDADGLGITVSYWRSREDIAHWRDHAEHRVARQLGKERWYSAFSMQIAHIEHAYEFTRSDAPAS